MQRVITSPGLITLPGLIDLHVHLREPGFEHKETILTGCRAAARGGFTTICCMPNTLPVIDNPEVVSHVREKAEAAGFVNVRVVGALSKGLAGLENADYTAMAEAGAVAFSDDGKTLTDEALMLRAAREIKKLGLFITDHAEPEAEIVARDIRIARETGCHIHLQHISLAESVARIRQAKKDGLPITAEAAPHHFALTEKAVQIHGTHAKMNPPLRNERDRLAVIGGIADGTIDIIATDHAPHAEEEKALPFDEAPMGVVGLETAFAVSYTVLVQGGYISLETLVERLCTTPARLLGIENYGVDTGDTATFDINIPYVINKKDFVSKSKNTPFNGMIVSGRTVRTVSNGKIIYEETDGGNYD